MVWSDADRRRDKAMQAHWSTAIHNDGYLYGSSGRHDVNAELRCIELATGKIVWSQPDLTRTTLLYVDGYFIALAERGTLRLVKATRRQVRGGGASNARRQGRRVRARRRC